MRSSAAGEGADARQAALAGATGGRQAAPAAAGSGGRGAARAPAGEGRARGSAPARWAAAQGEPPCSDGAGSAGVSAVPRRAQAPRGGCTAAAGAGSEQGRRRRRLFQARQSRLQDVVRGPAADRDQPAGGGERQPFRAAARRVASFAAAAEIGRVSIVVRAGRRKRPGGDLRHALRAAGRIGIEHLGDQRPDPQVDRAEIGHLAALLQDRSLAAAHVDRLAGQRFDQHEPETVDVGLGLHVAAEQPELFG